MTLHLSRTPIGHVISPVETWSAARESAESIKYIDIGAIDRERKRIDVVTTIDSREAPSRAKYIVRGGDILVSTVRPNLNAVAMVPSEMSGAVASNGFSILRTNEELADNRFLFHWVRSTWFVDEMVRQATGASYPAVSASIVEAAQIPLPLIVEQRRIAAILDRADAIRRKRQEAIALTEQLLRSTFLEMFGDPVGREWPMTTVGDLVDHETGSIRTGPFGSDLRHSEFVESGIAVLGIDNAVENEFFWGKSRFISPEKYEALRRYTVFPGDVIITIMGTCGRCAIVPDDIPTAINTKHLCCITLDKARCLPEFLHSYFLYHSTARAYLERTAKGAIMEGLNLGIIKALPVPVVPMALQRRYHAFASSLARTRRRLIEQASEAEALFNSLVQRAFTGQL